MSQDDIIFIPAGTIHAIGAGIVIAEIQQRSDVTFRLFDHGRQRELHIERAVAVADAGPVNLPVAASQLSDSRTLLLSNAHFVFEKVDLAPNSAWCLEAERETWLLVLHGDARVGSFDVGIGDAVFAQSDRVDIQTGPAGMVGLAAYTGGGLVPNLLQRVPQVAAMNAGRQETPLPVLNSAKAPSTSAGVETTQ